MTTYEGRPLARPDDEVVDQGLRFDLDTLLSRRRVLGFLGIGAATVGLAACGTGSSTTASAAASTSAGEIPEETAGPYPGDGSNGPDVLEQSGVVRSDITTSFGDLTGTAEGVPVTLSLTVEDLAAGGAFEGAAVYVWHCTREGGYSLYSDGVTDQNYLRGVQVADADGVVTFTSIWPACYNGRWPHVHFEVYPDVHSITDSANVIATSQIALPQDVCETVYAEEGYDASVANLAAVSLDTDGVFSDGADLQTPTVTGSVAAGYAVSLSVAVDTTTEAGGGGMGGAGMGGTPPSGGPGGGGAPPSGGPTG
ncbi:3,4-dioxygenase subunit beta [Geodermatophilus sp. Leaf369]|uniref:dioxygenase family protein n=1 Tax=Geodermatophilus sp. Leaf369 TaxID=1736354 RepID=UPI0006FFDBD4|nr:3,4-dioxygenase subunit beta [Geodermatophilus sp. Leaf369]KQS56659.1 3,4-dioxygenase subunit beta [Geodermatophilus sp. Leaf369]